MNTPVTVEFAPGDVINIEFVGILKHNLALMLNILDVMNKYPTALQPVSHPMAALQTLHKTYNVPDTLVIKLLSGINEAVAAKEFVLELFDETSLKVNKK